MISILVLPYTQFLKDYQILRIIGSGSNSLVYLTIHQSSQVRYVLKVLRTKSTKEAFILGYLYEQGYLSFLAYVQMQEGQAFLLPFVEGRSLGKITLSEFDKCRYLRQLLDVILHLHHLAKPIILRDIHQENVIINHRLHIIDFGDSELAQSREDLMLDYQGWLRMYELLKPKYFFFGSLLAHLIYQKSKGLRGILIIFYYRHIFILLFIAVFFLWYMKGMV